MRTSAITVIAASVLSLALTACGGSSSSQTPTPTPVSVAVKVTAASATTYTTGTDQFTATVTGSSNTDVTWSIQEGSPGGTISSAGMYTAPAAAGTYHVVATSEADKTKSATMSVTVTAVVVSVAAKSPTVYASNNDQFTATVTGCPNTAVKWSIKEGAAGGTISAAGVYTAPSAAGTYHVIATSQADSEESASYPVAVTIPSLTFGNPPPTSLAEGATYTYAITASDAAGAPITYTLTAAPAGASISGSTLTWTPTAAELVMPSSFSVRASDSLGSTNTLSWTVTPLRAVTMNIVDYFWSPGGSSAASLPPIPAPVGALVPGLAKPLVAELSADGTYYTIHNVPAGYYWLESGPTEKYWTNTSTFDVGTDYVGAQLDGNATPMSVTFSSLGLDPDGFTGGEAIWVGQANANSWFAPATQPGSGATSFTDSDSIPALTLPALTAADDSYVLEYEWNDPGNAYYEGLSLTYSKAETAGTSYSTPITGSLTAAPTTVTLDLMTSGWSSLAPVGEPVQADGKATTFFGTYMWAQPYTTYPMAAIGGGMPSCIMGSANVPCSGSYAGYNGWPSGSGPEPATITNAPRNDRVDGNPGPLYVAWAERCQASTTPGEDNCEGAVNGDLVTLSFATPFSSSWPYVVWSQQELSVPVAGASQLFTAYSNSAYAWSSASTVPTSTFTLQPAVETVTSPTINGSDFYTSSSPSKPLILSWTAAKTNGGARLAGYDVTVYSIPTGSNPWGDLLAKLYTTGTSLTVPTGLLPAGSYVFVIESVADASASLTASPYRSSYPKGTAQAVSAAVTISGS